MAGSLIAVWSPKGGTGKTLIATGLAMHLARRSSDVPTMLIDLAGGTGGVAALLQTSLRPCVLDYAEGSGRTVSHPGGAAILPGPPRLVDEALLTGEVAAQVLDRARAEGYQAVVDMEAALRDATVIALEKADAVLLITTPDLLSLYACRRFVQEAELIGISLAKFRLVINRGSAQQEIPDAEIRSLLDLELAGKVPSLPGLAAAINRGMSTPTFRSNTDFAAALHRVADSLSFAGIASTPIATVTGPLDVKPAGLIQSVRRWWRSL